MNDSTLATLLDAYKNAQGYRMSTAARRAVEQHVAGIERNQETPMANATYDRPFSKEQAADLIDLVDEMHDAIRQGRSSGQGDPSIAFSLIVRFGSSFVLFEEMAKSGWIDKALSPAGYSGSLGDDAPPAYVCQECEFSTSMIDKADTHERTMMHRVSQPDAASGRRETRDR